MSNEYKPTYVDNADNSISIMENTDTISFCKTGTKINTLSAKNVAHKKTGENLNLCAYDGSSFNPVITINNNNQDCRIMTNLNIAGNLNIIGNGIINTSLGIGTSSLNNGFTSSNVHTNSILDINGQTTIRGHILPSQNEQFDLGNAQYKIRHLFLSNNSLWIGDKHKIDVTDGTIKFRKRKTTTIPTSILAINGGDTEEQIKTYIKDKFGHSTSPDISDIKLEEWHTYAQSKQLNIKIEEIFKPGETGDWDENDTTMDKLVIKNNLDVSGNINLTDGMIKTTGIGSFGSITTGGIQNTNYTGTKLIENTANRNNVITNYGWSMYGTDPKFILGLGGTLDDRYPLLGNDAGGFLLHINGVGDCLKIDTSKNTKLFGMIQTTGIGSFGSITTTGSINTGSGSITTTGQGSFGNVGIGVTSPDAHLHIYKTTVNTTTHTTKTCEPYIRLEANPSDDCDRNDFNPVLIDFKMANQTDNHTNIARIGALMSPIGSEGYESGVGEGSNALVFCTSYNTSLNERMRINHHGYVGIGENDPKYPLHITKNVSMEEGSVNGAIVMNDGANSFLGSTEISCEVSIKVDGAVWVSSSYGLVVSSDSRIKINIVDVPDNLSLQQLRSIPCRYYEYIDKVNRGSAKTIGFIAQEVKTVMPMAISLQKEIIPDVYKPINCNWISVNDTFIMSSSDLPNVNGIKYKFYVSNESDYSDVKSIELTGNSDDTFTFDAQYINVFCYGKEVDDFHTIDKNKLFTLNFSATQEIDRIQQTHITEIASLKSEVSTLKTEINTLETENQQQQTKINELTSIIDKLKTANSFEEFKQTF